MRGVRRSKQTKMCKLYKLWMTIFIGENGGRKREGENCGEWQDRIELVEGKRGTVKRNRR